MFSTFKVFSALLKWIFREDLYGVFLISCAPPLSDGVKVECRSVSATQLLKPRVGQYHSLYTRAPHPEDQALSFPVCTRRFPGFTSLAALSSAASNAKGSDHASSAYKYANVASDVSILIRPVNMATLQNSQDALPVIPALDNSYGAMLLGTFLGGMLYGLTVHQTYRYFRLYPRDPRPFKLFILYILTLETVHTMIWIIACYHFLITDYFKPNLINAGHWSDKVNIIITGLATIPCQGFYARRVFLLHTKTHWIVALAILGMLGTFGLDIIGTIKAFQLSFSDFARFSWIASAAYGCAILTDVVLTGALIHVLLHSRTGFKHTDSLINTLIVYSINTGLLTGITGLMAFIFALILPGNYIYAGISIVNIKLYANSVLAIVNSRRSLASSTGISMVDDFELCQTSGHFSSGTGQASHSAVQAQFVFPPSQVPTSLWQSTGATGLVSAPGGMESGRESPLGHGKKDGGKEEFAMDTFIVNTASAV